jgi:hypothetical protein
MTTLEEMMANLDAARRIKDQYDLHRVANDIFEIRGKWFAFSIEDGKSDGHLYDRRYQCIRHQKGHERLYGYVQMQISDMSLREAIGLLSVYRKVYKSGRARVAAPPDEQHIERLIYGGF